MAVGAARFIELTTIFSMKSNKVRKLRVKALICCDRTQGTTLISGRLAHILFGDAFLLIQTSRKSLSAQFRALTSRLGKIRGNRLTGRFRDSHRLQKGISCDWCP